MMTGRPPCFFKMPDKTDLKLPGKNWGQLTLQTLAYYVILQIFNNSGGNLPNYLYFCTKFNYLR